MVKKMNTHEVRASELISAAIFGFIALIISTVIMMIANSNVPNIHPVTFSLVGGVVAIIATLIGFFIGRSE